MTVWRKSSYSGSDNGDCVELAGTLDMLRDSKNPAGPALRADLGALLAAIKENQLDR
ncbi:MAG TPA: DUF397 domain-containing protein [Pseudonocardiaceae bacterium]|jgi:hypothetical protein|nr:DUF397 domain-containing protein [Pseudonocardiaceae bacterium]